jgi:NADPH:quinone reductase-like Zn-dependent oxidoreductase
MPFTILSTRQWGSTNKEETQMKAIVCTKYGPPEVLQLKEVATPAPKDHEVLIRIFATAVTSSDCLIRGSKVPLRLWLPMRLVIGFTKPRNPILGMVLAGEVESVGTEVTRFQKGNQVYAFNIRCGTYAEYTCLPENSVMAFKPSAVTYEEAAAVPYGGLLALHFQRKSQLQSGKKVLIYGASGAVGTAAIQLAKHFGAEVTGVCSTTNLELKCSAKQHSLRTGNTSQSMMDHQSSRVKIYSSSKSWLKRER